MTEMTRGCHRKLAVGLSDRMNMFATTATLAQDPLSSPVAKRVDVQLLRRAIFQALKPSWLSTCAMASTAASPRRVAFIHRSRALTTRRGIFNLEELLHVATAWGAEGFTVEFEGLTLLAQVEVMQTVTVVVGVTGTGLWNAIWMRDGGLGVQLFPFGVGFKGGVEFENAIRHGPGHYVAWHATRYWRFCLCCAGGLSPSC
jgi:capsular polysaccharide biosynthesis protein